MPCDFFANMNKTLNTANKVHGLNCLRKSRSSESGSQEYTGVNDTIISASPPGPTKRKRDEKMEWFKKERKFCHIWRINNKTRTETTWLNDGEAQQL